MRILIALALLSLPAMLLAQTPVPLQSINAQIITCEGGTTACTTPAINTTGATLTVAACNYQLGSLGVTCALTSSPSCTWVPLTQQSDGLGSANLQMYYALNCTGSSQTFTCTGSTGGFTIDCGVLPFSGGGLFDAQNGTSSGGTAVGSLATGSVTLASTQDLVVSAWGTFASLFYGMSTDSGLVMTSTPGHRLDMAYGAFTAAAPHNCTSNSCGSYTITASSQQNPAWQAFDGNAASSWWLGNGGGTDYIQIQGPSSTINSYTINTVTDNPPRSPKTWTLKGSNDGSTFTTCDTQTNVTAFTAGEARTFTLASPCGPWTYYRFGITANQGDATYTGFAELYLSTFSTFGASVNPTWTSSGGSIAMAVSIAAFKPGTTGVNRHRAYVINH